jgi:cbb3-type cytochrome oxidase maturation protein
VGVIIILIAASLLVATGFLLAFIWSVSKGQFEDDTSPAVRMLFDSEESSSNPNNQNP